MNDEMGLFQGTPFIINVGVEDFGVALEKQGVLVVYVQWTPPLTNHVVEKVTPCFACWRAIPN